MSNFQYPVDFKYGDRVSINLIKENDIAFYGCKTRIGVVVGYKENLGIGFGYPAIPHAPQSIPPYTSYVVKFKGQKFTQEFTKENLTRVK